MTIGFVPMIYAVYNPYNTHCTPVTKYIQNPVNTPLPEISLILNATKIQLGGVERVYNVNTKVILHQFEVCSDECIRAFKNEIPDSL